MVIADTKTKGRIKNDSKVLAAEGLQNGGDISQNQGERLLEGVCKAGVRE